MNNLRPNDRAPARPGAPEAHLRQGDNKVAGDGEDDGDLERLGRVEPVHCPLRPAGELCALEPTAGGFGGAAKDVGPLHACTLVRACMHGTVASPDGTIGTVASPDGDGMEDVGLRLGLDVRANLFACGRLLPLLFRDIAGCLEGKSADVAELVQKRNFGVNLLLLCSTWYTRAIIRFLYKCCNGLGDVEFDILDILNSVHWNLVNNTMFMIWTAVQEKQELIGGN